MVLKNEYLKLKHTHLDIYNYQNTNQTTENQTQMYSDIQQNKRSEIKKTTTNNKLFCSRNNNHKDTRQIGTGLLHKTFRHIKPYTDVLGVDVRPEIPKNS